MKLDNGLKLIKAEVLVEILQKLPPGHYVLCNRVGNLLVAVKDGDYYRSVGFVDFLLEGEYEAFPK